MTLTVVSAGDSENVRRVRYTLNKDVSGAEKSARAMQCARDKLRSKDKYVEPESCRGLDAPDHTKTVMEKGERRRCALHS